jgi:hypothetical protein
MRIYPWSHDGVAPAAARRAGGRFAARAGALVAALALTGVLAACKDKDKAKDQDKGQPAPSQPPVADTPKDPPAPPPAPKPDFSAWDPAGKAKAWTGSWVLMDNGSYQAWTVGADGKVEVWEDGKDSTFRLEVEIPCYAYFATDSGMKYPHPFTVLADGALRSNSGGGGYRKGSEAIFCDASGTIYALAADGACSAWSQDFAEWKKEAADCRLAKNAEGKDVFFHAGPNEGEYLLEGDAILGGSKPTERADSHDAAKTAAAGKNAAK